MKAILQFPKFSSVRPKVTAQRRSYAKLKINLEERHYLLLTNMWKTQYYC